MASSPATLTPPPSQVDTNLLRNAIRLVHCIQKERGSSCAYYADSATFEYGMLEARAASDISAGLIQNKDLPVIASLIKIRNLIARHKNPQYPEDKQGLHRIFVCFNTLVSSVVHQYILKQVTAGGTNQKFKSTIKNRHRRGLSFDINEKMSSNFLVTPETVVHKTEPSVGSVTAMKVNLETLHSFDSENVSNDSAPPPPPQRTQSKGSKSDDPLKPSPPRRKVSFQQAIPKVQQLLDLLHIFVQLKESAGVERAILSSLLAFRTTEGSLGMLMNDLILEVEKQRSLVNQMEQLPEGPHRNLLLDLAQLSPELKELQSIILADFESLRTAEYDSEAIWNLITLYVDKLHSVELLIIEELECCLPAPMKRTSSSSALACLLPPQQSIEPKSVEQSSVSEPKLAVNQALEEIFPPSTGCTLLSQIESMSAEELKKRIITALQGDAISQPSMSLAGSHHYSAAASLQEDMNKALHSAPKRGTSKEWEIDIYEIKFTKRIGQGASATTYLASWTGQNVAVKVASITKFGVDGWTTEIAALQRLHHPNIIRLLGSIYHENPLTYCLVLEYCNAGDLATTLKYPTPRNFFFHVAISIANAMIYLHSRNVIHRDLKPGNVLCDGNVASGNFKVKVTDFGVATEANSDPYAGGASESAAKNLTGETGTYRWMAPEVIRHETYSSMADVYSFAIMMWQFLTHEEPFLDISAAEAAQLVAMEKERPPMPQTTPKAIVDLIHVNWSDQPNDRMPFEKISATLKEIQTTITAEEKSFLESPYGHPVYVYEELELKTEEDNAKKSGKKGQLKLGKQQDTGAKRTSSLLSNFFGGNKKSEKNRVRRGSLNH
jgi:serine/threonine protein kinase